MILTASVEELAKQLVEENGVTGAIEKAEYWATLSFSNNPKQTWMEVAELLKETVNA